ncbi:MAG: chromosomal replication initiator protein DnaA [Candidatus Pacebacteria bacterium]|nr:chromosomal replication initiator protein DnaA [Candidatus Paceibacterota bacterium]
MSIQDTNKLWQDSLNALELEISKPNFNTWFKNTHITKEDQGMVYIGVPNEFVKEWLYSKYHKTILRALRNHEETVRNVEYVVSKNRARSPEEQETTLSGEINSLPLHNLYVNKKDNLNPRYTFETFIIGPFNELAYSAAQAIVKEPGIYNPLFIYGNTGLGKTHLIQAVGNALKEKNPEYKIYYVSSEKFSNDFVHAIQSNQRNAFKEKYKSYDILIMDDVQFLSGKEKTQEELFHLFNSLYDSHKQIMFSSDKHPNYIPGLEDRLKSRFSAGMIIDVTKPEYESRYAILQTKARSFSESIPEETLSYIAHNVEGNVRELEGILNSLVCQTRLKKRPIAVTELKNLIRNNIKPRRSVNINEVVESIAKFYNTEPEIIYDKTRRKEIVKTRQIIMYILREDFNISYPMIGKRLGGRDHTTVIHSCTKIERELTEDSALVQEIEQLRTILSG